MYIYNILEIFFPFLIYKGSSIEFIGRIYKRKDRHLIYLTGEKGGTNDAFNPCKLSFKELYGFAIIFFSCSTYCHKLRMF